MYELPLFPLNTVLFPGMPLPLHIYEERYKEMMRFCLKKNSAFGVVLIKEGGTAGAPAEPYHVGCTAEIAQVEELDEGRLLIMTIGRERFRVAGLNHDKPYFVGSVVAAPLVDDSGSVPEAEAATLFPLVKEYLDILARTGNIDFDAAQIPTEPIALSYLAATIIQLPSVNKQQLLEMDKASHLIRTMARLYRDEVALMHTMPPDDRAPFSLN